MVCYIGLWYIMVYSGPVFRYLERNSPGFSNFSGGIRADLVRSTMPSKFVDSSLRLATWGEPCASSVITSHSYARPHPNKSKYSTSWCNGGGAHSAFSKAVSGFNRTNHQAAVVTPHNVSGTSNPEVACLVC